MRRRPHGSLEAANAYAAIVKKTYPDCEVEVRSLERNFLTGDGVVTVVTLLRFRFTIAPDAFTIDARLCLLAPTQTKSTLTNSLTTNGLAMVWVPEQLGFCKGWSRLIHSDIGRRPFPEEASRTGI